MQKKLLTPAKIRTLQRKLYCKAKSTSDFRFYALYDKVYRADILNHAYYLVRKNKGAPGIDGVSFETIEAKEGKVQFLEQIEQELKDKTYRSGMVRRVWIPKPDGSKRPLGIPTIKDRVIQMAVKLVIEPIFEADFCDNSYGFRPQRSAHGAADSIVQGLLSGKCHVIDADLSKYFDTIPHAKLMSVVAERISDGALLKLINQWLKSAIVDEDDKGKRRISGGKNNKLGTPQGGVLSPLLANLYLHLFDRIWERHNLEQRYRAKLVRYADDLVILCASDVTTPLMVLNSVMSRLGLKLNEEKTHVVNAWKERFDFLGFSFGMRKSRSSGKHYPLSTTPEN